MPYAVLAGEGDRLVGEIFRVVWVIGRAGCHHQHAALLEQGFAGQCFKLAPDAVRIAHQRQVLRPFAYRQPGDARITMAGTQRVGRCVLVDPQHIRAFSGQLIKRGGTHRAKAQNGHVTLLLHLQTASRKGSISEVSAPGSNSQFHLSIGRGTAMHILQ